MRQLPVNCCSTGWSLPLIFGFLWWSYFSAAALTKKYSTAMCWSQLLELREEENRIVLLWSWSSKAFSLQTRKHLWAKTQMLFQHFNLFGLLESVSEYVRWPIVHQNVIQNCYLKFQGRHKNRNKTNMSCFDKLMMNRGKDHEQKDSTSKELVWNIFKASLEREKDLAVKNLQI